MYQGYMPKAYEGHPTLQHGFGNIDQIAMDGWGVWILGGIMAVMAPEWWAFGGKKPEVLTTITLVLGLGSLGMGIYGFYKKSQTGQL